MYLKKKKTEEEKLKRRKYYEKHKDLHWEKKINKKFGLTKDLYEEMLKAQNYVCAICKQTDTNKRLAVDHCHRTNRVRGLLCGRCNPAIGYLQDNTELAQNLINYLQK